MPASFVDRHSEEVDEIRSPLLRPVPQEQPSHQLLIPNVQAEQREYAKGVRGTGTHRIPATKSKSQTTAAITTAMLKGCFPFARLTPAVALIHGVPLGFCRSCFRCKAATFARVASSWGTVSCCRCICCQCRCYERGDRSSSDEKDYSPDAKHLPDGAGVSIVDGNGCLFCDSALPWCEFTAKRPLHRFPYLHLVPLCLQRKVHLFRLRLSHGCTPAGCGKLFPDIVGSSIAQEAAPTRGKRNPHRAIASY